MIKMFELYTKENDDIIISIEDYIKRYENIFKDRYIDIENRKTYKLKDLFIGVKAVKYNNVFYTITNYNPKFSINQKKYKKGNYINIENYDTERYSKTLIFRIGSILSIYDLDKLIKDMNELIDKKYYIYFEKKDLKIKNIQNIEFNPHYNCILIYYGGRYHSAFNINYDKLIFKKNKILYNNIDPFGEEDWDD